MLDAETDKQRDRHMLEQSGTPAVNMFAKPALDDRGRAVTCVVTFSLILRKSLILSSTVREGFEPSVAFWTTEL